MCILSMQIVELSMCIHYLIEDIIQSITLENENLGERFGSTEETKVFICYSIFII